MKKVWLMLVAAVMVLSLTFQTTQVQAAAAVKKISIYIDGQQLYSPQAPIMVNGRTLLPMRAIFEALNAEVQWNSKTKTVTANRDNTTIVLKIGAKTAVVNNGVVKLDVPAQIYKGSTMVPVRFISEALGEEVNWNPNSQKVTITTSGGPVDAVSYVSARVVAKNGDGRDVEVSFPKIRQESGVNEYRVLIVKSNNAYGYNLAQALSTNNYTSVRPDGDDISITLSSQTREVNGDLLRSGQSYAAYVLTVGKQGNSALSGVSQTISLSSVPSVGAPSNVNVSDVSDYGDGRDLSVSFTKPQNDGGIANYRVLVVKTKDKGNFDLSAANNVASANYTVVNKSGTTMSTTLSSSARDTSGDYIKNSVSYTVYVLATSNNNGSYASQLSAGSSSITLASSPVTAPVITKVDDVSNYGDGRDLRVNFNRVSDESRVSSYRIFVVKDSKAGSFNLSAANNVSSSYYTQVNKNGYNISQVLSSGARDVDGSLISNGIYYRVFVMSVGTGSYSGSNALSSASSSIVLSGNYNVAPATNVSVSDVGDYNDGRDLRVSFTRTPSESEISGYRIMVVKSSQASNFNLSLANSVSSGNYTSVGKTGYNISQVLSSGARDVDGSYIRNGISYRVFVLSVGSGSSSGNNALSSYSPAITLTSNTKVESVSNIQVSDVSDYNDGRDLRVSFNRASEESTIGQYRIMVVKSGDAGRFDLNAANGLSSSRYTAVSKTGSNISQVLSPKASDVDGDQIKNGVSYRVFVLSVGTGSNAGNNALSGYSPAITLQDKDSVKPATHVVASDIGDNGDGSDLQVTFTRAADESNIDSYRVLVVKESESFFDLTNANSIVSSRYTKVPKTGSDLLVTLKSGAMDVSGAATINDVSYKVYVLSVGSYGTNALSDASVPITLTTKSADPATDVKAEDLGNNQDGRDLQVSFKRASDESNIKEYRILVVNAKSDGTTENEASKVLNKNYKAISPSSDTNDTFSAKATTDIDGKKFEENATYKIFVLSVSTTGKANKLSNPATVELKSPVVEPATNVKTELKDNGDVKVSFTKPKNESAVDHYEVYAVPVSSKAVSAKTASDSKNFKKVDKGKSETTFNKNDKDINGKTLDDNVNYLVYVLTVANGDKIARNVLSTDVGYLNVVAFDENNTEAYTANMLVSNEGKIYQVLKNNPSGKLDDTGSYKLLKKAEDSKDAASSNK